MRRWNGIYHHGKVLAFDDGVLGSSGDILPSVQIDYQPVREMDRNGHSLWISYRPDLDYIWCYAGIFHQGARCGE